MSYYKYQGPEKQINWAKVGKDMSDMLGTEQAAREEKREQIDTQVREDNKWISDNATYGDLSSRNAKTAQLSNDMSEFNKLQYSLLKSGQLSLQDYTRNRQNLMDNAEIEFSLDKMLQDRAGVAYNRMNEPASDGLPVGSYIDEWNVKQAEKLLKTKNARTIINRDGTFSKVLMVKNPETGMFEELGAFETSELKDAISAGGIGQILTRTDSKEAGAYKKWEEDQIGAIMSNTNNLRSILTDVKINTPDGKDYDFTYDKEAFEKDNTNSLIYINRDESSRGVYEFKPEQKKIVEETLKTAMRASIDEKHEVNATSRKQYPPTGPAAKTPPIEYRKFNDAFMEEYGKKIKNAYGNVFSDEASIRSAKGKLPGLGGFTYRVKDGVHELYTGSGKEEYIWKSSEYGPEFAELMLLQSLEYSIGSDGIYNTGEKQKAYAGKKGSSTTTNSTGGTSR
jgi:hypothetical protein